MLKLVSAPATEPITLAEAKAHLRVDDTAEDDLILNLIAAYRSHVDGKDGVLNRALITQTWDLYLDRFPYCGSQAIQIPLPPLQSITSVKYYDTDAVLQTMSSGDYFLDSVSEPAQLHPAYNMSWPTALDRVNSVIVRFVAGYGSAETDVPQAIRQAGLLVLGHWYANRESVSVGNAVAEMPQSAKWLLDPFKVYTESSF